MTTGRINQVTAEEAAVGNTACAEPSVAVAVRCVGSLLPIKFMWSRMRPRMGFALVRTTRHAGVSTRLLRIELA